MAETFRSGILGEVSGTSREAVVVGAGVSGLVAAYYLKRRGYAVRVLEAQNRVGGLIATLKTPQGLVERAAHSFIMTPAMSELVRDLGVEVSFLKPEGRRRYIYRDGNMRRFPLSGGETARLLWRLGTKRQPSADLALTVKQWGETYLGKAGTQYLLDPMVAGIYAGDVSAMSWSGAFPSFEGAAGRRLPGFMLQKLRQRKEKKTDSSGLPSHGLFTFRSGTESFIEGLKQKLFNEIETNSVVTASEIQGFLREKKLVIVTVPAPRAAELVPGSQLQRRLRDVQYVPLMTCTVFVTPRQVPGLKPGIGVLIPSNQGLRSRGVLFNSCAFEGRVTDASLVSLTVILGGARDPEVFALSDGELKATVTHELRKLLSLQGEFSGFYSQRWPAAIPHYTPELQELWRVAQHDLVRTPGLMLFGNYTGQVSVRGLVESWAVFDSMHGECLSL